MDKQLYNINVVAKTMLPTPADIKAELPIGAKAEATVLRSRQIIQDIIDGRDSRLSWASRSKD